MYADPTLMDLAAAYAKRRNGRKTKHAVACDRPGAKSTHAAHPSWSEGVLGDKANPALVAYAWIDRNIGSLAGRTHMLLADLAATAHRNNPSASVQQAVLAAAKDMVRKGVAPADIKTFVENGGRFSRPGAKAKMAAMADVYKIVQPHWAVLSTGVNRMEAGYDPRHPDNDRLYIAKRAIEEFMLACQELPDEARKQIANTRVYVKNYLTNAKDKSAPQYQAAVKIDKALDAIYLPLRNLASRPGAKAKMGLLDRLGAAASALAGPGKDPTTQEYKTSVAEAKKAAIDEVKNYAFMVKQNDQKLAALDAYVKSTSKAIATLNSAPEILRLTDGLRQAVKARSVLLQTLKMPFGRDGAKVKNASQSRELTTGFKKQIASALRESEKLQDKVQDFVFALDKKQRDAARSKLKAKADQLKAVLADAKSLLSDVEDVAFDMSGLGMELGQSFEDLQADAIKAQEGLRKLPALQAKLEGIKRSAVDAGRATSARRTASRPGAKSTHAALPPQTLEAERKPGGGSHSEAVSRKIATLINEGKPQDQAVAIALDLERRGEL